MFKPILTTKFYIPPARTDLLPRTRLIEQLNIGTSRGLTLISASAGFGKTTLLSQWIANTKQPVAWLSLDEGDNNPKRFWTYLIQDLQQIQDGIAANTLEILTSSQTPSFELILTNLINEIAITKTHFSLILDDYHVITEKQIHNWLSFLMENLPKPMHLVIATRNDPPWPLARLRARREIIEIRSKDLRFTSAETSTLFKDVLALDLSAEEVHLLDDRVEGWIAGLQMAALSIQGREQVSEFIRDFTGSNRFILDYLLEEILNLQTPEIQDFLLRTSVLDRMTASLCQVISGQHESQEILEYLDRANLFLVPLDDKRSWYRYHHLFGDLLRVLLTRKCPSEVSDLHLAACYWFEKNGFLVEALKYALASNDVDRFARLIAGNAVYMIYIGELRTLEQLLQKVPPESMSTSPWLGIAQAWVKVYMGQHEMVASLLDETEFVLKSSLYDRHDQDISAHIDLIRGFSSYYTDDIGKGITYLRKALENLPDEDLKTRCYASGLLGAMLKRKGILDEAEIAIEQAIRLSRSIGFEPLIADTLTDRISLRISQGRLHEAFEACQEALQIDETQFSQSGKHLYTTGRVHYFLSVIHLSRFELGKAIEHVQLGLALAQKWGKVDEIAVCYSGLAQMYMEYGNSTKALRTMRKTRQIAGKISPKWEMMGNLAEARLHLSLGNIKDAVRFSQDFDFQHGQPIDYAHLSDYLFFARLYSVQGKFDKAISILDQLKAVAEPAEAVGDLIPILVTQASTLRKSGQTNKALEILADALGLAEPEKIIHPFITGGAVIKELLRKLEPGDKSYSWVNQLLAVFEGRGNDQQPTDMLELLSERELEVLQYLNTHLSSTEIARELHISANTVRFHIKNIYSKLNVNRRAEAVEKAIELGLL